MASESRNRRFLSYCEFNRIFDFVNHESGVNS